MAFCSSLISLQVAPADTLKGVNITREKNQTIPIKDAACHQEGSSIGNITIPDHFIDSTVLVLDSLFCDQNKIPFVVDPVCFSIPTPEQVSPVFATSQNGSNVALLQFTDPPPLVSTEKKRIVLDENSLMQRLNQTLSSWKTFTHLYLKRKNYGRSINSFLLTFKCQELCT